MIDLQMLSLTEGGGERSSTELPRLLDRAGLMPGVVRHTPTDLALVEATAPVRPETRLPYLEDGSCLL
jgi:hypothetical protein